MDFANNNLINTTHTIQKKWICNTLRKEMHLLREAIQAKMAGKREKGRPRMMLLEWMLKPPAKNKNKCLKKKA